MGTAIRLILMVLVGGGLTLLVFGQAGWLKGKPRGTLGAQAGKLQRPSQTENSVSSQANDHPDHPMRTFAQVQPLTFAGDGEQAMLRLVDVLRGMARIDVVEAGPDYIYATQTTKLLRFVDDVEFALDDAAKVIHVRSASRLGQKDFGVNRARVEAIRKAFQ